MPYFGAIGRSRIVDCAVQCPRCASRSKQRGQNRGTPRSPATANSSPTKPAADAKSAPQRALDKLGLSRDVDLALHLDVGCVGVCVHAVDGLLMRPALRVHPGVHPQPHRAAHTARHRAAGTGWTLMPPDDLDRATGADGPAPAQDPSPPPAPTGGGGALADPRMPVAGRPGASAPAGRWARRPTC